MFKGDYKWQHDYVRLAFDTGFSLERLKSDQFDKNRISAIDIDRIIDERDFATIESNIPYITKFVLDREQAEVLDGSFVKVFRLSQLAIQYLLYCKKYLDNTLILLKEETKKLKEENKELNLFVDDLQGHISSLMKQIDEKPTFKCGQCSKIFSSDDFLQSHMKRRHSAIIIDPQTDQLQMEIKELKGRLNSAEKMIQNDVDNHELKKVEELQQRFEELRIQVQSELKVLQTQHNFQERYEKWFEKMAVQGGVATGDLHRRRESTTQTEIDEFQDSELKKKAEIVDVTEEKENIPQLKIAEKQITEFGEALESKVTSSLEKIEVQMQSFWKKLNEMERYTKPIKPRTKFTLYKKEKESPNKVLKDDTEESLKKIIKIDVEEEEEEVTTVESEVQIKLDENSLTSSSEEEVTAAFEKEKPKPLPAPRKRLIAEKKKNIIDDELLEHFRKEIDGVVKGRLQDLGVSPDWKGLPTHSFQRALEIVNHQANLMKKSYPNFDYISTQIEKTVSKKIGDQKKSVEKTKTKKKKKKEEHKKSSPPSRPVIEIKNRKMYDTDDSENEINQIFPKENLKQFLAPYNAVIEELKTVTSKIDSSDKSEVILEKEDQTKGVLKNYPSVGSLTKKKVLFNLETDDKKEPSIKDGGSTTSITSSIFDPTPRKEEDKKKEKDKDIEDLSDFDFSDM